MNIFGRSVFKVLKGALKSFKTYPAAMASALAFTIVAVIKIFLDDYRPASYDFILDCLQYSFALGATLSLATVVAAKSRLNSKGSFIAANLVGVAAVLVTFILLYLFGGREEIQGGINVIYLSGLSISRILVTAAISILLFIIFTGYPKEQSDFSKSLFMIQKAFFIALLYGIVLYSGAAGVAGAIKVLLFRDMNTKIYAYIAAIVGFIAYAVFVGYFPDFSRGVVDERRVTTQKQPKFIEILFQYIMAPLALALTVVLVLWVLKTIITGEKVSFAQLSGIAASYAGIGLWLHIMLTHSDSRLSDFYRRVYPLAALVILVFEARMLLIQIGQWGIKTTEYFFTIIWIVSVAAMILLIAKKEKSHIIIAGLICLMLAVTVLPIAGYVDLPVATQKNRLEKLLTEQEMFEDGRIIPAVTEPEQGAKEKITDSINFLIYEPNAGLPDWLDPNLGEYEVFRRQFGFDQTWPKDEYEEMPDDYKGIYITLAASSINIEGYEWAINIIGENYGSIPIFLEGDKGDYTLYWNAEGNDVPTIKIDLEGRTILEQDISDYINTILEKYPLGTIETSHGTIEDMSLTIEAPEVNIMLVFSTININKDPETGRMDYWLEPRILYMREK